MNRIQNILAWSGLVAAISLPIIAAAMSPLLAWRDPIYIVAGFAGVAALALLLLQPLLIAGLIPGLSSRKSRQTHRWIGATLFIAVIAHVAGLWITSPPDVIDALLFASPTPFSFWGVVAMWAVFVTSLLAVSRRRLRIRPRLWRTAHTTLAALIVLGSVIHAMLIEGTMETFSKIILCILIIAATVKIVMDVRRSHQDKRA